MKKLYQGLFSEETTCGSILHISLGRLRESSTVYFLVQLDEKGNNNGTAITSVTRDTFAAKWSRNVNTCTAMNAWWADAWRALIYVYITSFSSPPRATVTTKMSKSICRTFSIILTWITSYDALLAALSRRSLNTLVSFIFFWWSLPSSCVGSFVSLRSRWAGRTWGTAIVIWMTELRFNH